MYGTTLNEQRFTILGLYLKFGLYRIPVYLGSGLDRFHCTFCTLILNNLSNMIPMRVILNQDHDTTLCDKVCQ